MLPALPKHCMIMLNVAAEGEMNPTDNTIELIEITGLFPWKVDENN
jgi:hypothetical protein